MFYLPAILLVTLIAGWQSGVAAYVASIAIGWYLGATPHGSGDFWMTEFFAATGAIVLGASIAVRHILLDTKQAEARLRNLVEASSGIVFTTDSNGRIQIPHPSITELTGIAWDNYRGHNWRHAIHTKDLEALPENLSQTGTNSFLTELRVLHANTGEWRWYRVRALPLTGADGVVREWVGSLTDIHEARLALEQRELLVGELRHRMKNLVTVISALAKSSHTNEDGDEVEAFLSRFLGRLHALGAAADIVLASNRMSIETGAVIRATLRPFDIARFKISGPVLQLSEQTGGGLAMAVHELATNALKYGALSVPEGSVTIAWTRAPVADGERIVFEWTERGGPEPKSPNRQGFGTRLIGFVPLHEKAGDVKIEYRAEGLYCRIEFTRAAAAAA